jgi:hypothetical protein
MKPPATAGPPAPDTDPRRTNRVTHVRHRPGRAGPPLGQVLDLRRERMDEVHEVIAGAKADELERNCVPPESPGQLRKDHTVLRCVPVILKEEWQHHRRSGTSRCLRCSRNGPADRSPRCGSPASAHFLP